MAKFGSGATVTTGPPSSETCVLQASRGLASMSIPHDPQTPMRHDDRQARVGDSFSLISFSPSRTVMPGEHGRR